jgi:hypothetical protein
VFGEFNCGFANCRLLEFPAIHRQTAFTHGKMVGSFDLLYRMILSLISLISRADGSLPNACENLCFTNPPSMRTMYFIWYPRQSKKIEPKGTPCGVYINPCGSDSYAT